MCVYIGTHLDITYLSTPSAADPEMSYPSHCTLLPLSDLYLPTKRQVAIPTLNRWKQEGQGAGKFIPVISLVSTCEEDFRLFFGTDKVYHSAGRP